MTEPTTPTNEPTTPANPATPPTTEVPAKVTFSPEQQAELDRLIGNARKEGRTAAEQAAADAETARQAEAARQADIAKGNFDAVKTSLEGERDTAKSEAATLKEQNEAYAAIVNDQVEALKKDLPAELLTGYPEDGTPLAKLTWLKDRKQVFEVAQTAAGVAPTNVTRLPKTPSSSGAGTKTVEQMTDQMRGRVSI